MEGRGSWTCISSIVGELDGTIDLESTVGMGTSFHVALPALL